MNPRLFLALLFTAPAFAAEPAGTDVPYRLTDSKHVLVRTKMNGKGPYNLILDTGAPAVFIPKKIAKDLKLDLDDKGWGTFDTFELEGGLKIEKTKTRVEDLFQLEGMNGLGLAGVELHGVIGYNVLAQFRITYDFTKDKLHWVPLKFDPPKIEPIGKGEGGGQGGLDIMGNLSKMMAGMLGIKPNFEIQSAGFLGVEIEEKKDGVHITNVWKDSPADKAGVKIGDKFDAIRTSSIDDLADMQRALAKTRPGDLLKITLLRKGEKQTVTLTLGKGL